MTTPSPYPPQHSQACFDVRSQRCVCPIGNVEAAERAEAHAMAELLRENFTRGPCLDCNHRPPDDGDVSALWRTGLPLGWHADDCKVAAMFARIDAAKGF